MLFKKAPFFERVLQSEGKSHSLFKPAVMQMDVDELRSFSCFPAWSLFFSEDIFPRFAKQH